MNITLLKSKLHRATVTEANLNYVGSITIDSTLMERVELVEYEQVSIANINNGARFETYVIKGEAGSGVICLNGAAARQAQAGDKIIIMSYASMRREEASRHKPVVVFLGEQNEVLDIASEEKGQTCPPASPVV